ncbi:MAG: hypothetical protein ACOH2N_06930 [Devosia sp.]
MKRIGLVLSMMLALTGLAQAVSVGELIGKCGDDGKAWCAGVGYGEPMQQCLDAHYSSLSPACKSVMDRLRAGERVYLF